MSLLHTDPPTHSSMDTRLSSQDSAYANAHKTPPFAPSDLYFPSTCTKGNILILTEDLGLVLSLRNDLLKKEYNLTWTNNLWIALSYIQSNSFAGLVFDLQAESVEEHFALHLLEDYQITSRGAKVFLSAGGISPSLGSHLKKRNCSLLEHRCTSLSIVAALNLSPAKLPAV